ncbi:MAG: hypothetical protein H0U16_13345, partial [Actinobacteria bacterium]|nr:hypothetical protein [Actinomycetota bacterium]
MRRNLVLATALLIATALLPGIASANHDSGPGDSEVTVGSNDQIFPQNKQNEPGLAVDPIHPDVLAAGANDNIDLEACNAGADNTCPFTPGVGVSGVQFSFNGGDSWMQPTYSGYSARVTPSCLGVVGPDPGCVPDPNGPIGTLPHYYENDLVSNGDPELAFGPQPDANGDFSWDNGSRLYFSNIATNFPGLQGFKGSGAIAVSRTDDVPTAAQGGSAGEAAWMEPVIVTKQSGAVFNDKEQIWADNVDDSPFFGNAYVCNVAFRSNGGAPEPVVFARSTDGGDTWDQSQITNAANTNNTSGRAGGRQGCTIRTDSDGVVYVFFNSSLKRQSAQLLARSFDGGRSFEKPFAVADVVDVGSFDPITGRFTFDGLAGARTNSFPSVDIANGAPFGDDPTSAADESGPDTIGLNWADARMGLNDEEALVQFSTDKGVSWTTPVDLAAGTNAENGASDGNDRPDFPAIALSPDGTDLYVTYMGFLDPFRQTTADPRRFQGVVRHADLNGTTLGSVTTLNRAPAGDGRASSANALTAEFLGDYNYAVATNDYGAAVWTDDRDASVCAAINVYRQSLIDGAPIPAPAPQQECAPTFGNSSIYGGG